MVGGCVCAHHTTEQNGDAKHQNDGNILRRMMGTGERAECNGLKQIILLSKLVFETHEGRKSLLNVRF